MGETVLSVQKLVKRFGQLTVLDGLSFDIEEGDAIVILGSSGCGKSTLLRCINGLEKINGGKIILRGRSISELEERELTDIRRRIGMVFQSYELFPHLNVLDNITLAPIVAMKRGRRDAEEEAMELLKRVGLEEKSKSYPRELSGGQKQRAAIVRALCVHPEIMLFDEVTAALDPEMVREVLNVILDLADCGMTMLIVTHEINFAKAVANRVILLDNGVIAEESSPDRFFTLPETEKGRYFLNTFNYERKESEA